MRVLITSALPYINGIKHLGNLVGSILPADVFARFNRQIGNDVLYICATDEHGTPAELAAKEQNMPVAEYCEYMHKVQKKIYDGFDISFDEFGRSSHQDNHELTRHFSEKLEENGYIEERTIKQLYSEDDGRFLPDRYVNGTCPHCGYENARGDQCESCTRVLDPEELINPRSAISGSTNIEITETKHLFLKQSVMVDQIEEWINTHHDWPDLVSSIAHKWIKEGLHDRCITRDLNWGVAVNKPGYEEKVYYVWFDAPIAYIAATKTWSDKSPDRDWESWWKNADEVMYYEFMAKDNVPFHTISFPATLIGSGEPWKLVDHLKGFNWLTFYGGKFSTSQKRGIFTDKALEEMPSDYWRYWLMANVPESSDSSFTFEKFGEQINKDLNGVLGNFVNRIVKFCINNFGEEIPEGGVYGPQEKELASILGGLMAEYKENMSKMEFRKALQNLRAIWAAGNNYLASAAPWTAIKTDKDAAAASTRAALNLCHLYGKLSWPIIPASSNKLLKAFGNTEEIPQWPTNADDELNALKPGASFKQIGPLFERIAPERIEELTQKYGGEYSEEEKAA